MDPPGLFMAFVFGFPLQQKSIYLFISTMNVEMCVEGGVCSKAEGSPDVSLALVESGFQTRLRALRCVFL